MCHKPVDKKLIMADTIFWVMSEYLFILVCFDE